MAIRRYNQNLDESETGEFCRYRDVGRILNSRHEAESKLIDASFEIESLEYDLAEERRKLRKVTDAAKWLVETFPDRADMTDEQKDLFDALDEIKARV